MVAAAKSGAEALAVLTRLLLPGEEGVGAMRLRGSDERHPMARSGRMLLSPIVLGIVFAGGMAVLPVGETTSAPAPTALRDAVLAEAATPGPHGAVAVVAAGLTNPRSFTFTPDGTLVVALAGREGPHAGVVRIEDGCPVVLAGGLPAYRIVFGAITGVADVAHLDGQLYALLSGGDTDRGSTPNGLYRLDGSGGAELVADISAFIREHPVAEKPRDFDTDGQPYAMLAMGDAFWVTEGNSNQLLRVGLDGTVARVADLSYGHPIPTGIAPAPDGGAYVAFFTAAPYAEDAAKVVKVAPDGAVTDVWTDLTLVTALAIGPDGTLYALEMATGHGDDPGAIAPGTGRVVRMTGRDAAESVVTGLTLPVAMDFGPDGALYIAGPTFGADEGQGTILRIDLSTEEPVAARTELPAGPRC